MQIPLNVLLYRLSANSIYETQNIDLSKNFDGIKLFDEEYASHAEKNYLYMISDTTFRSEASLLLGQQILTPCSYLCICRDESTHIEDFHQNLSVILLYTKDSFSSVFNHILNIFHDFNTWDKEFHLALLHNASMQTLLNMSSTFLAHPMVVLDRNYTLLGHIQIPGVSDPIMDRILADGYVSPQTMNRLRQDGLLSTSEKSANPFINYYCLTTKECYYSMMYRFHTSHHEVGYALVFQCSVHPKTNYLYLMNAIADNLGLYFQQDRYRSRSTSDMYEAVLSEIMEHPDAPMRQYEDQVSYIPGLSMEGHFLLAQIDYPNRMELPYAFACWNLRTSLAELKPFVCRDTLYVLRTFSDTDDFSKFLSAEETEIFQKSFRGYPVTCGVSGAFFSLRDLSVAAMQCKEATELGCSGADRDCCFYYFGDFHTHYLLKELKKHVPMEMISSPCYTVLKQYDKEHGTDLCDIFMLYLKNGRNINQTSAATFLHRNTILNKIKKAVSVMHNDFEDAQMLTAFVLSYLNDHM